MTRRKAPPPEDPLLSPGQVAVMAGVNPDTVSRWAARGLLVPEMTGGGHRRFRESVVAAFLGTRAPGRACAPGLGWPLLPSRKAP